MSEKDIELFASTDGGLDLEEIAALIDGRLDGADRARVVARLAEDEASYEVFAEVLRLQEEESSADAPVIAELEDESELGEVVPIDRRVKERRSRPRAKKRQARSARRPWLPVAATVGVAAVLTLAIGAMWKAQTARPWASDQALIVAGLEAEARPRGLNGAELKGPDEQWYREGKSLIRGDGAPSPADRVDFSLGVQVIDLHIALTFSDRDRAMEATQRMIRLLDDERGLYIEQESYRQLLGELQRASDLPALRDETARLEGELEESIEGPYFDLGIWVEAGRLAVAAGEVEYFTHRKTRYMVKRLRKAGKVELAETIEQICARAVAREEVAKDLTRIARRLGALI